MATKNLRQVLDNLKSEKIKERQEGLASIRTVFARDQVVANFYITGSGKCDPRMWLTVFQALFSTAKQEAAASTKKATTKSAGPSAVALRRLGEAANVIRWLTERTIPYMNKRVVQCLFDHFFNVMAHNGKVFSTVALDYAKAIRCLISYKPHLYSLEDELWLKLVEFGFNVVLGDPIKTRFEDDSLALEITGTPVPDVDSDMYMDDDEDEDSDELPVPGTQSIKRRRRERIATSGPSTSKANARPRAVSNRSQHIAVSLEQVEWASNLSILLGSTAAPILSTKYPQLVPAIFVRLRRFLELYPADSSLLHDYIMILFHTLRHVSLNKKVVVENFAREAWDGLVGLWGTKDKSMKEGLVVVLRTLLPYIIAEGDIGFQSRVPFDCSVGIGKLWSVLNGEAESRWGVDGLSLDALRLEPIVNSANDIRDNEAFVAKTFRAGWNFDSNQALAWAILELQADCAGRLFQLSESMHSSTTPGTLRGESKRIRLENPVASLLSLIQIQQTTNVRAYHLQVLLFFVDRHWSSLHFSLKEDMINTLLALVSVDDGIVQSWVFLNFAAIAHAEGSRTAGPSIPSSTWDSIWTHAIRRASVSGVCRAACHAGHTLIDSLYSQSGASGYMLTTQRVLAEIESLAKDLDVQGPSYPYDSVCMFLTQCLRIASQDVRLYRMQLEEKVQTWLVDSWKMGGAGQGKMALHMVKDALLLLESICGLGKRCDLTSRILLPDCLVVESIVYEERTKVIRDFLLYARLPAFQKPAATMQDRLQGSDPSEKIQEQSQADVHNSLILPRGRERKMSFFLLKTLDALLSDWDMLTSNQGRPTAEISRHSLDMAVIALAFESVLLLNGTTPNRHVLQSAVKVVSVVTPLLKDTRWSSPEKALILVGLEPLVSLGAELEDGYHWEAMVCPDIGSGIRSQRLKELVGDISSLKESAKGKRISFLRMLWQNADVRNVFADAIGCMRDVLRGVASEMPVNSSHQPMDVDDMNSFGPIRTSATQQAADIIRQSDDTNSSRRLVEVCTAFVTVGPLLQSESGEPTRDKDLTDVLLGCVESRQDNFILLCQAFLDEARRKTLNITIKDLDKLLKAVLPILESYTHSRSQHMQLLVVHLLDSTLDVWLTPQGISEAVKENILQLCEWLSNAIKKQRIPSWMTRDKLARFLDRYLTYDPAEAAWPPEGGPRSLLPIMSSDNDIRVRFRVAFLNARLISLSCHLGEDPMGVYSLIRASCTNEMDHYERMLTRLLSFGNIMIISSAVRRGSYWHLLEICTQKTDYIHHIEAILSGISERLGLKDLSALCEAYALQLAFSIQKVHSDFFRFPPHLLGYRDRKQLAEATLRPFTPTYILTEGNKQFEAHCRVIQKSPDVGLRECFGDIVGFLIVKWFNDFEDTAEALEQGLQEKTFQGDIFEKCLHENADNIVSFMLGTLLEHDSASIISALRDFDPAGSSAETFQVLIKYRHLDQFGSHKPNLPAYPAKTVLRGLAWFASRLHDSTTEATTYHVLHELLAQLERSPFVNEQLRLVNALSLWISLRSQNFKDGTLLYTLMQGVISFLAQLDLARSAQSILEWAFTNFRQRNVDAARLPNILVRISCFAYDYASSLQDHTMANIGNDLLTWVDEQVLTLSGVSRLKELALRALPAWPRRPSPDLMQLYESISSESLSSVLNDQRITSNKFRLVRRLRDHAVMGVRVSDGDRFAKTDFWRLKECMPSTERLQDDDIDAFASLLIIHRGQITSFPSEQPTSHSMRERHKHKNRKTVPGAEEIASAPNCILFALLEMLQGDDASQVYSAYNTLRLIMPVLPSERGTWPRARRKELEYLQTYPRPPKVVDAQNLRDSLASDTYIDATRDFSLWVSMIASLLSDVLASSDPIFAQLDAILHSDTAFAEEILPILVHTLLREGQNTDNDNRILLSRYFTSILSMDSANVSCRRLIVDIVLHLRYFARTKDALSCDTWLDIDYTLLAKSAITCGAYTTSLLFLELAAEHKAGSTDNFSAEQVFYEIYAHIDEPDGFYGIQTKDLHQFLIKRFHHEKQWEKAFRFHGAALESGNPPSGETEGLLKSFHSFGFDHLAIDTLRGMRDNKHSLEASSSMNYRLGWRTETWDLPDCEEQAPGASVYHSLRATCRERDPGVTDGIVRRSLYREMNRLKELGSENVAEIREVTQDLMCLNQVSQWRHEGIQNLLKSRRVEPSDWSDFVKIDSGFNFSDLEGIMATRISLIRSVRQLEERQQIGTLVTPFAHGLINIEKQSLLRLSEAAREANQIQIALNSVIRAQRLEKEPSFEVSQEFANVLWLQREEKLAVQFLQGLVDNLDSAADLHNLVSSTEKALLLARLGTWTSEACLQKPTDIWDRYFNRAIATLGGPDTMTREVDSRASVYHESAMFAERQYHSILKSPDAMRWKVYVDRKKHEIEQRQEELRRTQNSSKQSALKNDQMKAERLLQEDSESYNRHISARDAFLKQAIDMYSRCLEVADAFDQDAAIRVCSLWFANFENGLVLGETLREALGRIPSRKLVFLAHQLTARLSKLAAPNSKNQEILQSLIARMCREHPFHSLYQVYCLRPSGESVAPSGRQQSGRHFAPSTQTATQAERAEAASGIFDRLRGDTSCSQRVRDVEKLCTACLEWAKYPIKGNRRYNGKPAYDIPKELSIRKIINLKVPVTTCKTPLDPTLLYNDCVWINSYEPTFQTAGGINVPKITACEGSDGIKYKQLFKGEGNDELRQDAVMEQVFELVNNILHRDRETRRRELRVREYKVIPLDFQAGFLEFVGNTMTLRSWLNKAHRRFRPTDISPEECNEILVNCHKKGAELQLDAFKHIRSKFHPVMRHYFTEKHKTPVSWFSMRLNYTRSVATTSIVGHILGLGDRHTSNILMDTESGEVVHIDLGIAFDQGKLLTVPERVPFRMTADMVDGMGITGTQGVFQRCAEETLRVLRDGSEVIMTVLEVFKHDPLHAWAASEVRIKRAQDVGPTAPSTVSDTSHFGGLGIGIDMSSGSAEEAADRALSSVARKLDKSLSVESTVNELIAEATDILNLATIFYGWGPQF